MYVSIDDSVISSGVVKNNCIFWKELLNLKGDRSGTEEYSEIDLGHFAEYVDLLNERGARKQYGCEKLVDLIGAIDRQKEKNDCVKGPKENSREV